MNIDHAYNAQERIELAVKAPQVEGEVPALVLAQIAQAEATLALVEQQRIANKKIAEVIAHVVGAED